MWILPTLDRPQQCAAVLKQIGICPGVSKGIVFVNSTAYEKEYRQHCQMEVDKLGWQLIFSGKNFGASGTFNKIFKDNPDEKFYGLIEDNEIVLCGTWEKILLDVCGDWNIAYGNDGSQKVRGFLTIGGNLARAVGFVAVPEWDQHFGLDDIWRIISDARVCERNFCKDVLIHRQIAYKCKRDEAYRTDENMVESSFEVYRQWMCQHIPSIVDCVRDARG